MLVVANLSRNAQCAELDLHAHAGAIPVELFGKTKFPPAGKLPADVLVAGDAELGVMQTSELIPGTELVGTLPGDLNNVTVFGAGLAANGKQANAGAALIKFLQSREAAAVYKAKGLDPS